MFRTRLLTALIGVPFGIWIILRGGTWLLVAVSIIVILGLREVTLLLNSAQNRAVPMWMSIGGGLVAASAAYIGGVAGGAAFTALILWLLVYCGVRGKHQLLAQGGPLLFAWAYWGYLPAHIVLLRNTEFGLQWVLVSVLCTWATDIGAYLVGSAWGRNKLAPTISPNKSIEGAMGGLAASVVTALAAGKFFQLPLRIMFLFGVVVGVVGQVGDLVESSLKREAGVKDSGKLFPGHGGVLDRFDSLVFVIPVVYQIIRLWMG